MNEELQKPPVVDIDALLRPISDENPSGEGVRYSGLYDEISEARRADVDVEQGEWRSELKVADFARVIDLAVPALTNQAKDLQVAAWLCEALIKVHGFAGLRDGLKLLTGLQENFWETLHPEIDEGDMEGRANAISWFDNQGSFVIKAAPITSGPGYGLFDLEDAKRFDIPENVDALDETSQAKYYDLKTQAEKEHRVTADLWRKAKSQTRRQFYEEANYCIDECWACYAEINRVIEQKYERNQMPGLSNLKKSLDEVHTQVKRLLEDKRIEEPDAADETESFGAGEDGNISGNGRQAGSSVGGVVQSRRDALKRLAEIAAFFQKTEPHSPVAYLVQRAVKWGNMPLENWLQDVIKDENVLYQLRQMLGLDSSVPDEFGEAEPAQETAPSEEW